MTIENLVESEYTPAGRCYTYLLKYGPATAEELMVNCDVSREFAKIFLDVFNSGLKLEAAMSQQVGGSHYTDMAIQPWEALEAWLTPEEYRGYHKGVAVGYLARERRKGGVEDIKKAIHHLTRLVETLDGRDT